EAAVGGAAVASVLGNDDDPDGVEAEADVDAVDLEDVDDADGADVAESADEAEAAEVIEEAAAETDIEADAVTTGDLPAGAVESAAAATSEINESDVPDASTEAPVFDSRRYSEEINDAVADDDDDYEVPAAARTVDFDQRFEAERKGNKAGILVGAILAAGLGVVAFQLLNSDDSSTEAANGDATEEVEVLPEEEEVASPTSSEAASQTEEETATSEAPATTVPEETATSEATPTTVEEEPATTVEEETATTVEEETATTVEAEPEAEVAAPTVTVDGPISAEDAGIQLLHGIPGVEVDVYLEGEALAPGFTLGTIAGPAKLDPGDYDVDIYAASESAPASAADRIDDPLIEETVTVGADPATLAAHLDGEGNPVISAFVENLETLEAGTGRVELRHLAAAPAVQATIDGEAASGMLEPGKSSSIVLTAGEHTIETATADGTPVKAATITVADGELANISIIGAAEADTIDVVVQRYTGLGSAPQAVPTGDSNLLAAGEDPTGLYVLGALTSLMAAAGGFVMIRRNRRVL
ncbi:MAG: DUF4397 domain-containing protein, partial [Acidimicrobiales bacterium]